MVSVKVLILQIFCVELTYLKVQFQLEEIRREDVEEWPNALIQDLQVTCSTLADQKTIVL